MEKVQLLLTNCLRGDLLSESEKQLLVLSNSYPEFYLELLRISADPSLEETLRLQALVYLRNAVVSIWRPPGLVSDEVKMQIRRNLLADYGSVVLAPNLNSSELVAKNWAILTARIARVDWPAKWPDLIANLAGKIDEETTRKRALLVLYHVTKELSSKRLASDRRNFRQLCQQIFPPVAFLFETCLAENSNFQIALLAAKSQRILLTFGLYSEDYKTGIYREFLEKLAEKLDFCLSAAKNDRIPLENREISANIATKLVGILAESKDIVGDFEPFLADFVPILLKCLFENFGEIEPRNLEKVRVKCFNILTAILTSGPFKFNSEMANVRRIFAEKLGEIFRCLVGNYFRLTSADLSLWEEDFEQFFLETLNLAPECYKYSILSASDAFYSALFKEYFECLTTILLNSLPDVQGNLSLNFTGMAEILDFDAILAALGFAAEDVHPSLDFESLFKALISAPFLWNFGGKILQRRAIWLCDKFFAVAFAKNLHGKFYALLSGILTGKYDGVVRLYASHALRTAVDDFEFETAALGPEIQAIVSGLVRLLTDCSEDDCRHFTKIEKFKKMFENYPNFRMEPLSCLTLLAERCGTLVSDYCSPILAVLSELWSADCELIKARLLILLCHLVNSLGNRCGILEEPICQILSSAVNPSQPIYVFLLEEGLELWLALVRQSPAPISHRLMELFGLMSRLLTLQSENLLLCFDLCTSYTLFGSAEFCNIFLPQICPVLAEIFAGLRAEAVTELLALTETFLLVFQKAAIEPITVVLAKCMAVLFGEEEIISGDVCKIEQRQVKIAAFGLVNRLTLCCGPETLIGLLSACQVPLGKHLELVGELLPKVSYEAPKAKLAAMACCACLVHAQQAQATRDAFPNLWRVLIDSLHKSGFEVDAETTPFEEGKACAEEFRLEITRRERDVTRAVSLRDALARSLHALPADWPDLVDGDTVILMRKYGLVK